MGTKGRRENNESEGTIGASVSQRRIGLSTIHKESHGTKHQQSKIVSTTLPGRTSGGGESGGGGGGRGEGKPSPWPSSGSWWTATPGRVGSGRARQRIHEWSALRGQTTREGDGFTRKRNGLDFLGGPPSQVHTKIRAPRTSGATPFSAAGRGAPAMRGARPTRAPQASPVPATGCAPARRPAPSPEDGRACFTDGHSHHTHASVKNSFTPLGTSKGKARRLVYTLGALEAQSALTTSRMRPSASHCRAAFAAAANECAWLARRRAAAPSGPLPRTGPPSSSLLSNTTVLAAVAGNTPLHLERLFDL